MGILGRLFDVSGLTWVCVTCQGRVGVFLGPNESTVAELWYCSVYAALQTSCRLS